MNFRKTILIGLAACVSLGAAAIPAKKGVRTFRQADGTIISVNLTGDEFFHTYTTTDGLAVSRSEDGNFHYRTPEGVSAVIAHDAGMRSVTELAFVNGNASRLSPAEVRKSLRARSGARKAPKRGVRMNASQVPSTGSPRVPVILVQYRDYKFKDSDPKATFTGFFSSGDVSAHQYFVDQSNGKYTPQFDVYGPYTLSGNRATYGGNDYYGDDRGVGKMVGEGCLGLDGQIDFSRYDNDGDGECDVVIVLYAGDGEASSYDEDAEDAVWPCQWDLASSDYGKSLTLDRTLVNKFAVFNELNGRDLSRIDGIGTFCHEFSHCLDLPDFYDTQYGPHFGMGPWSLMDYGSYNNDGYTPIGYSAYEKAFMGWIELEEGKENTFYNLPVLNQKSIGTDRAVRLTNPQDADEYYIIENRARQGWDSYMVSEGLLITHVTYSPTAWEHNEVNDYDLQRMTPVPADNNLKLESWTQYGETYYSFDEDDILGDLWPYGNATELTDTSLPAAKVNTGSFLGKPVTEITLNDDGTVSFWVMKAPLPAVSAPVNVAHNVESSTSATISWEAGDDTDVTYTVEVRKHRDITYELVSSTDFTVKNHGWATEGYTEVTADGVRLGSNKQLGAVTSPAFDTAADGLVTVAFNAKYYSGDESDLKVSLTDADNNVLDSQIITLTAQPADYTVLLEGEADTSSKVVFEITAKKKRAFIKSADIYTGDASEVAGKLAKAGDFSRTITGIAATSVLVSDLPANDVYDYRVKAVPTDGDSFSESPWSETRQFTLDGSTGVEENMTECPTDAVYFSLQGIRLSGVPSAPGIYIMRQGNKTRKVRVD